MIPIVSSLPFGRHRDEVPARWLMVRLATLPASGPTGGFFDENGPVPW
jgi:hypothetical protein